MAASGTQEKLEALLRRFYGPGNEVKSEHVQALDNPSARCARGWLEYHRGGAPRLMLVRSSDNELVWYALTTDEADARDLSEELLAFAGPSYSSFRGERAVLAASDPQEQAISTYLDNRPTVYKFWSPAHRTARASLAEALCMMLRTYEGRHRRAPRQTLPLRSLLSDFEMALLADNELEAIETLRAIRNRRLIDGLNLQFLQVQVLSHFGRRDAVLSLPTLVDLLRVRKPPRVTEAIAEAVYHVHLRAVELGGDIQAVATKLVDDVRPNYGQLTVDPEQSSLPGALAYATIDALASDPPQLHVAEAALAKLDDNAHMPPLLRRWLADAKRAMGDSLSLPTASASGLALSAMADSQFSSAIEFARDIPNGLIRAQVILECAFELQTNAAASEALEAIELLSDEDRNGLFEARKYRVFRDALALGHQDRGKTVGETEHRAASATDWLEWFALLPIADISDWRILEIAKQGATEWTTEDLANDASLQAALEAGVRRASSGEVCRQRLRDALPHILAFFQSDAFYPRRQLRSVYREVRSALALFCVRGTASDLSILRDLAEVDLGFGVSADEHDELLEQFIYVWETFGAPANYPEGLDLLDLLLYYPSQGRQRDRTMELASSLISSGAGWRAVGRVDDEAWRLTRQLAGETGLIDLLSLPDQAADDGIERPDDPIARLGGMVAIHTLMESAGRRTQRLIHDRNPEIDVRINSDLTATDRLKNLCLSADVFVVVTRSAKHSATDFIHEQRGQRPTLHPEGRGSSSVLRALSEYAITRLDDAGQQE